MWAALWVTSSQRYARFRGPPAIWPTVGSFVDERRSSLPRACVEKPMATQGKMCYLHFLKNWNPAGREGHMRCLCFLLLNLVLVPHLGFAQQIDWPAIGLTRLVGGINQPTHVTDAGDTSGRLFIVEQGGTIRIFKDGVLLDRPFLDIRD